MSVRRLAAFIETSPTGLIGLPPGSKEARRSDFLIPYAHSFEPRCREFRAVDP
jgi:hypothetical protein